MYIVTYTHTCIFMYNIYIEKTPEGNVQAYAGSAIYIYIYI